MAATAAKEDKISLKLMVHQKNKRVIFAEADGNFVDILFSFMTLPMGTILRLLGKYPHESKYNTLGSLTNVYQSLIDLPTSCMSSEESKFMMLNRKTTSYDYCKNLKLNIDDTKPAKYFVCPEAKCVRNMIVPFSICNVARCKNCGGLMDKEIEHKDSTTNAKVASFDSGVFVSEDTTFIVSDDLRVMPNSTDSIALLLGDFGITDARQLEEMTFDIRHEQVLNLLGSAVSVKYPLTELVFPYMHDNGYTVNLTEGICIKHLCSNAAKARANAKKITLKLILQKSTSKFLFAEAEADFVDFVFGFLDIPLGTLIGQLMNGSTSVSSLDNLYASISNMRDQKDIKSLTLKDRLLKPQLNREFEPLSENQIFPLDVPFISLVTWSLVSTIRSSIPHVKLQSIRLQDPRINGGFLKPHTRFRLTNDLVITPFSSSSTFAFLNKLEISMYDIEEHKVGIGLEEGLKILKASLVSRSILSDALLNKNISSQEN